MKKLLLILILLGIALSGCEKSATSSNEKSGFEKMLPGIWTVKWHLSDGDLTYSDTITVNENSVTMRNPLGVPDVFTGKFTTNKFTGTPKLAPCTMNLKFDSESHFTVLYDCGSYGNKSGDANREN